MTRIPVLLIIISSIFLWPANSFGMKSYILAQTVPSSLKLQMAESINGGTNAVVVDELFRQLHSANSAEQSRANDDNIQELVNSLSASSADIKDDENTLFDSLFGYYNVTYTMTARTNDNPVGGKWTRSQNLVRIKRTMQHILPLQEINTKSSAIAQVVNVIYLSLFGILPIWIVLRGDAVPLSKDDNEQVKEQYSKKKRQELVPNISSRAVRAYFDQPRIAIGKKLFAFGPTSSVVLDTTYIDDRIRIGVGGTSGTKFVFSRLQKDDKEAVEAWKWLLEQPTAITKKKAAFFIGLLGVLSGYGWKVLQGAKRWLSASSLLLSIVSFVLILSSTGGIETRGDTYVTGKE